MVEAEIREKRQWKIIVNDKIACVFVTAFNDPFIWKEKDADPAVYLHRIATNPAFRGMGFVKLIVDWSKEFAQQHQKEFIRLDTGSDNEKLNNYYISCGFNYLGVINPDASPALPLHYKMGGYSLFEMKL